MRSQRRLPVAFRAAAAVACSALLTGCLFSDTSTTGKAVHDAPKRLARSGGVALSVTFSSRLVRQGALTSVPPPDPGLTFGGAMDPRSGAAYYLTPGASAPSVVFSGDQVYARTPHASKEDARPWLSVTLDKHLQDRTLNPGAVRASLAAYALRPAVLLDVLSGALTGSIHKHAAEPVDGTTETSYDVRFDLGQAFDNATRVRYSQRKIDDVDKVLTIIGVKTSDLDNGTVWIDAAGNPRRIVIRLRESPVQNSLLLLTVDLRLTPLDKPVTVKVPNQNSIVTVPSLYQLMSPFNDAFASGR